MIAKFLKLKSWQLVALLSNYWLLSIIIQRDFLLIDILFLANMGLLFVWYSLVVRAVSDNVGLKPKFIYGYYFAVIYLLAYMITDIIPLEYEGFHWVLWQYIALLAYLFVVLYVTIYFLKAEERKRIRNNSLFSFVCFFVYPIGIFFINKRIKTILITEH